MEEDKNKEIKEDKNGEGEDNKMEDKKEDKNGRKRRK